MCEKGSKTFDTRSERGNRRCEEKRLMRGKKLYQRDYLMNGIASKGTNERYSLLSRSPFAPMLNFFDNEHQ